MGLAERMMTRFEPHPTMEYGGHPCWEWKGGVRNQYGYGGIVVNRSHRLAHRVFYKRFVGDIEPGLTLDHLCRNRLCVNPSHMEPVTIAENVRRGKALLTACKRGHPFDEKNTYRDRDGNRQCRRCHADRERRRQQSL